MNAKRESGASETLPNAGVREGGPLDGLPEEIEADEIAIAGELFAVDHFCAGRGTIPQGSDSGFIAGLPGVPRNDAGAMEADVVRVGFFFASRSRLLDVRKADHYNDR